MTLRSVTAPADDVGAVVVAQPVLRGAIGFPAGEDCPISRVALYEPGALPSRDADEGNDYEGNADCEAGDLAKSQEVDEACRFELSVPDGPTAMVLLATGAGWHLEEPITIPPLGDPAPICLNPPCRTEREEALVDEVTVY
jgi:hypothetical protein